jgi:hypothetical protein
MSWSVKITILYLGFVGIILTLVFTCFAHKTELEYKDYYAREINFQQQIDATNNATLLDSPITHEVKGRSVIITIPQKLLTRDLSGTAFFMRPSNASQDIERVLEADENGICVVENAGFTAGVYKMRLMIRSQGKDYFTESVINFK